MMDPFFCSNLGFSPGVLFGKNAVFFPYCYGQFLVILCALLASAPGKKTIARVTRIRKNCRILPDILTPEWLYSSWTSLPFVDFFILGASFFDQKSHSKPFEELHSYFRAFEELHPRPK